MTSENQECHRTYSIGNSCDVSLICPIFSLWLCLWLFSAVCFEMYPQMSLVCDHGSNSYGSCHPQDTSSGVPYIMSNHQNFSEDFFEDTFLQWQCDRWVGSSRQPSAVKSSPGRQSTCLAHQIQVQYQIQESTRSRCRMVLSNTLFSWFWHHFVVQLSWHIGQATGPGGK